MEDDPNENIQKDINEENTNSDIQTRLNESQLEILETDENITNQIDQSNNDNHSLSGDIELAENSTEISRMKDEQYSARTSRNEGEISIQNDKVEYENELVNGEGNDEENQLINITVLESITNEEEVEQTEKNDDEKETYQTEEENTYHDDANEEEEETNREEEETNREEEETNREEGETTREEEETNKEEGETNIEEVETNREEEETNREEEETNRDEGETNREEDEANREEEETNREEGEANREEEETNREEEETNRDEGETNREEGETNRDEGETNREEGETNREEGETNREEEETNREEGETNREEGETNREEEETNREEGETTREEEETNKEEGETNREEVETNREEEETNREEEETNRDEGETNREEGEANREEVETNREEEETNREEEETNRVEGETNEGEKGKEINEMEKQEINHENAESKREEGGIGMAEGREVSEEKDTSLIINIEEETTNKINEKENFDIENGKERVEGINKANQIDEESDEKIDLMEMDNKDLDQSKTDDCKKMTEGTSERNNKNNDGVSNFFTAPVQLDDGTVKNQLVTIVRSKCKKTFLGGYRHKVSGIVYHHASVQTMPKPRPPPTVELFSRDTQTFQLKHQKINTDSTTSTQMTAPGVYLSNITDKLMVPKKYETADDYKERILQNIVIIQKYYRRWLAKQIVDEKRKQRDDRLHWQEADKERKQKEKEERIQNEYKRRMHPKTKADFDLLYSDLEKWREEQLSEIDNSNLTEAEKKARKALLLEEETDLLAAIDRHKLDRKEETKTEAVQKMLSKAAAPKSWKDAKGRKIEMNTQFTIRSRELLEIFNSLNMQYLTPDERLDVLLTLKHTVKEHDCKLTKEIVELIDREADLIMRNVKEASLAGLRKRISTLFLQYCKTPTFNPQISSLLKVPADASVLVGDINYCKYCGRYLRSTEFSLSTKSSKLTICKSCARKDNQSRNRQDYSHYRRILKEIQMTEQQIDDGSKIAFIFKQNDVKSLIESVWDGKSVMSGCDDLDELIFLRWDNRDHWTPWNTIFLTKDEAEAHVKVTNLVDTYSNVLINRITQKHVIAKNMFGSLEKMIGDFQSRTVKVPVKV